MVFLSLLLSSFLLLLYRIFRLLRQSRIKNINNDFLSMVQWRYIDLPLWEADSVKETIS